MRENRPRWFGRIMRREKFKVVRMVIDLEGNKGRRRPKKRWLDVIVGQCVNDARDRVKWRFGTRVVDPKW